jgi:hypothetical protein
MDWLGCILKEIDMELPKTITLQQLPDGYVSQHYKLTIGKEYVVHGEMGSCVVIESDSPGERVSLHRSRFVPPNVKLCDFNEEVLEI